MTSSSKMMWCRKGRGKEATFILGTEEHAQEQNPEENSKVHLLPAFALLPRSDEDEKKAEEKGREINAITTNVGKKWSKLGQALGSKIKGTVH